MDDFKEVEEILKNDGADTYHKNNVQMEKTIAGYCRKKMKNRMPKKHSVKVSPPQALREITPYVPNQRLINQSAEMHGSYSS